MSDTLPMPDPAAQVAEIRAIIEQRTFSTPCESVLLAIKHVIAPPPAGDHPVGHDRRGWPELSGAVVELPDEQPGTAWERHDDPEQNN